MRKHSAQPTKPTLIIKMDALCGAIWRYYYPLFVSTKKGKESWLSLRWAYGGDEGKSESQINISIIKRRFGVVFTVMVTVMVTLRVRG